MSTTCRGELVEERAVNPREVVISSNDIIGHIGITNNITETESQAGDTFKHSLSNETIFRCGRCQKTFKYLKRFNVHKQNNACGVDAYICGSCGLKFNALKNLKRHVKTQHQNTKYQCVDCQKVFSSAKSALS